MDAELRRQVVRDCMEIRTWATETLSGDVKLVDGTEMFAPPRIVETYNRVRSTLTEAGMFAPTFEGPPAKVLMPPEVLDFVNDVDVILQHVS